MKTNSAIAVVLAVLPFVFAMNVVCAEGVDKPFRYDSFTMEGTMFRFDRETGALEKLSRTAEGLQWVPVDVRIASGSNERKAPPQVQPIAPVPSVAVNPPRAEENAHLDKKREPIKIFGPDDEDITDVITDFERNAALPLIASYGKQISPSSTVKIGDRVNGIIFVKNNSDKKLKRLEITLSIPVIGKEKPEEHHFMFSARTGAIQPPQPGAEAVLQKVDLTCPAGGVKGSPDVRVSFIEFQ